MTTSHLRLNRIAYTGPQRMSELLFQSGVNVVCGASDTGKSFLAESVDFMLGGKELREIPERTPFGEIQLDFEVGNTEKWRFHRSISGGNFFANDLYKDTTTEATLKWQHGHGKTDNLSGFLLDKLGLNGKRILRSKHKGTTQSLSFRNLARLIIVQEGEIQQKGSPFWGGQYTLKTAEMAAIKLLLTGVDDSAIVSATNTAQDNTQQIALIDELLAETRAELLDIGEDKEFFVEKLGEINILIEKQREHLDATQGELNSLLSIQDSLVKHRTENQNRIDEITDHIKRFKLLEKHYSVDEGRLKSIQESGSTFTHVAITSCPLCGAPPNAQKHDEACDGNVDAIVEAAVAEIDKIVKLREELNKTVEELAREAEGRKEELANMDGKLELLNEKIKGALAPLVREERTTFSNLIEQRAGVQRILDIFLRTENLEERKKVLEWDYHENGTEGSISTDFPDYVAHQFSLRMTTLLKAWDFPGDCMVHFDKNTTDFVIDGKPRASRGKGLRAITHAAVTISLLEYCQEHDLPHPGFVVLDSPLLAYFKPEGDDEMVLQGTKLKERFYQYLTNHHTEKSQIIIIENQHPPDSVLDDLKMTIFTGNPNEGRPGLL